MLREAAERTGDAVGDGTSTATILAHAILVEGLRNIAAGASAIDLKRGLDRGVKVAVASVRALSRPVTNRKEKAQIAAISAHNDAVLGELVADAMERVGGEGVVSVEEAKGTDTSLEVVEGMQIDRYLPVFHHGRGEDEVVEEPLFCCTKKIASLKELVALLKQIAQMQNRFWSSPKTLRRAPPLLSSTSYGASSCAPPSSHLAMAIAAKRLWKTWRSSLADNSWRKNLA
jgi:chaperonin GroEL